MRPNPLSSTSEGSVLIGARLRAARQARAMTMDHVARATGLSKGFISRIERDDTSPSVATLNKLCTVLDISVGMLFETPDTALVRYGEQPMVTLVGDVISEFLLTPRRQRRLQLTHAHVGPGDSSGADLYTISCAVEVAYVLRGTLDVVFATGTTRLVAGDTLTFSGHEPHTWRNPDSTATAEVLWVMIPAPWSTSDLSDSDAQ